MDNLLLYLKDLTFLVFNVEKTDGSEMLKVQIPDGSDEFSKQE
jgi:hypothetical protein